MTDAGREDAAFLGWWAQHCPRERNGQPAGKHAALLMYEVRDLCSDTWHAATAAHAERCAEDRSDVAESLTVLAEEVARLREVLVDIFAVAGATSVRCQIEPPVPMAFAVAGLDAIVDKCAAALEALAATRASGEARDADG